MIAAARPDPTVLSPSWFYGGEIAVILGDIQGIFGVFLLNIHLVSDVFQIFVIMVLSQDYGCYPLDNL